MPTPFMHLHVAQRLLDDPTLPDELLRDQQGAFLLGNVAPDARITGSVARVTTHFFHCRSNALPPAGDAMLAEYPALRRNGSGAARIAFLAGYIAHLAMDIIFCRDIVYPYMVAFDDPDEHRAAYQRLHLLLSWLDVRDYARLPREFGALMHAVAPDEWLPFIPDAVLADWRDLIAGQFPPHGTSRTLEILGERINRSVPAMTAVIESPQRMQHEVWHFIPREAVEATETAMYAQARADVVHYLET